MCVKTLAELLNIPPSERFTSMLFVFVFVCFPLCFIMTSMKEPGGSLLSLLKRCDQGPTWTLWSWRSHWWPWNVVLISLSVSSDQHRHFSEESRPFPSLISALAVSRLCHSLCPHLWFQALAFTNLVLAGERRVPIVNIPSCLMIPRWKKADTHNLLHPHPAVISLHLALLRNRRNLILAL